MSKLTFNPNTYAGEAYAQLIMPSLVPAGSIVDLGLVTLMTGIKKRTVLRPIDVNVTFQDPSCNFNAQSGDPVVSEVYIDPVKYEVMIEMCYEDVRKSWDAMKLKRGSMEDYTPTASLEDAFLEIVHRKIAIMNQQMFLLGKAGVTAGTVNLTEAYPGLIARLVASSSVKKVLTSSIGGSVLALTGITIANPGVVTVASTANLRTGDTVTITDTNNSPQVGGVTINGQSFVITVINATTFSLGKQVTGVAPTSGNVQFLNKSNVIDTLAYAYTNMPETARWNPDTKVWAASNLVRQYWLTQGQNGSNGGSQYVGKKESDFLGTALTEVPWLPANTVIVAPSSNIFLGVDETGDETEIETVDMRKTTLDQKFRYKGSMKTDINFVNPADILLINPVIA